ncbi:transmembrane protein 246-like [Mizuhopecten yessoensis]|uniref:Transmembrane protein 246 n=1 Tax=Mizuhopecten yessoensis TaxID=6573 RepID=A0A210QRP0_MIZYE|nr:transmembrane protein 246-like [Mizuhopecten yessoensis]OWF51417.1 Transmembrane protein 246 [Mizuhopecten yessoensis]
MCGRWKCLKTVDRIFVRQFACLCVITFCVVLPIICLHLQHSWYYLLWKKNVDRGRDHMRMDNNKRIEEANDFLKKFSDARTLNELGKGRENGNHVDVGITIITVSRNRHRLDNYEPKYLTQVVTKFLKAIEETPDLKHTYKLFLCDVDPSPSSYIEIKPLSKLVPVFQRFRNDLNNTAVWSRMSISDRLEKEKRDYVFCGRQTLNANVSNIFLVEDDALPHEDLLPVLDRVISNIFDKSKNDRTHYQKDVTYIKFYHPERLLGYFSLEPERLPELFGLSFLLSTIMMFFYQRYRPVTTSYTRILWLCFFVYSCLLLLFIGRQNLLELRRISSQLYQVTRAPACCTPAILYPSKGMEEVLSYLSSVQCKEKFGKDYALEKFRTSFAKTGLMVQPNLFTHIGMYSSLRNEVLDPFIV